MAYLCARRAREEHTSVQPSSKRLKFDANIEEQVQVVLRAVDNVEGRSSACQVMLSYMVPGCLGPALDERDKYQMESVEIIGRVLKELEEFTRRSIVGLQSREVSACELSSASDRLDVAQQDSLVARTALVKAQERADEAQDNLRHLSTQLHSAKDNIGGVGVSTSKKPSHLRGDLVRAVAYVDARIAESTAALQAALAAEKTAGINMQRAADAQREAQNRFQRAQAVDSSEVEVVRLQSMLEEQKKAFAAYAFLKDRVRCQDSYV
uniref:Uncharacterized protein n=1 Tax=Noctiluca scintillans TaxID=2966 RepID=A0A7S1AMQ6_NOCSC|eukprot:CAMPEP_0194486020 /NCGR_PEP_ID=MMETSP0253-20130528/6819_1 /TAXON_ID=2966 /ORGANISM="Noctiluca scintillans" /LENGTH=265 /DNA_ID=CAMNT_0039326063 /DNA_START=61 /DNA_END=858 /DNA_ORIENTATION=-